MGERRQIKDGISLSRGERNGIIALTVLVIAVIVVPGVLLERYDRKNFEKQSRADSLAMAQLNIQCDTIASTNNERGEHFKERYTADATADPVIYELNAASNTDLQKLPGIGPVLSERIIKYRDKLGGFYSAGQLAEVYGLSRETYDQIAGRIRCNNKVRKISVNSAGYEELSAHPYISPKLAAQIVSYRSKVKPYEKLEDIKALYFMTDSIFGKLSPYLEL